jgi:hypothetical protein
MNLLTTFVKPTKPLAFDSLVKRAPSQWTHWAQPPDTVIMDQVTSNGAESTMNMIGHEVSILVLFPRRKYFLSFGEVVRGVLACLPVGVEDYRTSLPAG